MSSSIHIRNQSGGFAYDSIFAEQPQIEGDVPGQIYSCVIISEGARPDETASFEIQDRFTAITGSSQGRLSERVLLRMGQGQPAQLGSGDDKMLPAMGRGLYFASGEPSGNISSDSFAISTNPDLTSDDPQ